MTSSSSRCFLTRRASLLSCRTRISLRSTSSVRRRRVLHRDGVYPGMDLEELLEALQTSSRATCRWRRRCASSPERLQGLEFAHRSHRPRRHGVGHHPSRCEPHNIFVSNEGRAQVDRLRCGQGGQSEVEDTDGRREGQSTRTWHPSRSRPVNSTAAWTYSPQGIVLYSSLLTGEKPFGEEFAAVSNILNTPTTDPRELRANIAPMLVEVIDKAFAKDKSERYQTADLMVRDLEAFLQSRPKLRRAPRAGGLCPSTSAGATDATCQRSGTFVEKIGDIDAARQRARRRGRRPNESGRSVGERAYSHRLLRHLDR